MELRCTFEHTVSYCHTAATWQKLNLWTGKLTPVKTSSQPDVTNDDRTCVVVIKNVTPDDSGLYYCISFFNTMAVIGNGTRVIVTGKSRVKCHLHFF